MWQENMWGRAWLCCLHSVDCRLALQKLWDDIPPAVSLEDHGCPGDLVACECHSGSTWYLCVGRAFENLLSMKGLDKDPHKPGFTIYLLRQQKLYRKIKKKKSFQIFLLVLQAVNLYPFLCTFLHQNWERGWLACLEAEVDQELWIWRKI